MKIIVCIKQVPARDSQLRVASSGAWIQDADLSYEINEPDAYALEEGLQLKEKHGGEVVVLCAGPARAAQTIREALAKGADRAIHIGEENLGAFDALGVASLLAAAPGKPFGKPLPRAPTAPSTSERKPSAHSTRWASHAGSPRRWPLKSPTSCSPASNPD